MVAQWLVLSCHRKKALGVNLSFRLPVWNFFLCVHVRVFPLGAPGFLPQSKHADQLDCNL